DVCTIRDRPCQTSNGLSSELGRGIVSSESATRSLTQTTDSVDVYAVHTDAQTHERTQGPFRSTEVINDVGHQGGRGDVAFRRVARTGSRGQVAQTLCARDGTNGADVTRAVAAFEFGAPVRVEA